MLLLLGIPPKLILKKTCFFTVLFQFLSNIIAAFSENLFRLFLPKFLLHFSNSKTYHGVFSPEKLRCDPVQLQRQAPEKVPDQKADEVPESSGADG